MFLFTSKAEMEREFSVAGVNNRLTDYLNPVDQEEVLDEIIDQATSEAKAILNQLFDDSDLSTKTWIRRRCTIIACYFLSIRKGNDSEYFSQYLDALADFQDLIDGRYSLDLPVAGGMRAAMVNIATDNRFSFAPIRADHISSTSGKQGLNFVRFYVPYVWF